MHRRGSRDEVSHAGPWSGETGEGGLAFGFDNLYLHASRLLSLFSPTSNGLSKLDQGACSMFWVASANIGVKKAIVGIPGVQLRDRVCRGG